MKAYCQDGCRNYTCDVGDVHVYEQGGGFVVCVNLFRVTYRDPEPLVPQMPDGDPGYIPALTAYYRKHRERFRRATSTPLGGDYAGECLHSPSPLACVAVLDGLRRDGYLVPQHVTDALRAEAAREEVAA